MDSIITRGMMAILSSSNYWCDYAGVDEKIDSHRDELRKDGTDDMLYVIDSDNKDQCPLMKTWVLPLEFPPINTALYVITGMEVTIIIIFGVIVYLIKLRKRLAKVINIRNSQK